MTLQQHTVKSYDEDLQSIAQTISEMSKLAAKSLDYVSDSMKSRDLSMIQIIKDHDNKINSLDLLIEKKVTSMLALRQPMGVDLRFSVSALKAASNLERVGDQAKNIIKKITRVENIEQKAEKSLQDMIMISKKMVLDCAVAFNGQDIKIADLILKEDDKIDDIYRDLFKIINEKSYDSKDVENIVKILFVAKSFERIADHATNIAEITSYVVTGKAS